MKKEIYGLYGREDGLYGNEQVNRQELIGDEHFLNLENCSHNVFIDRPDQFIDALKKWVK